MRIIRTTIIILSLSNISICLADAVANTNTNTNSNTTQSISSQSLKNDPENPVEARAKKESRVPPNFFSITLNKPTYILPYYYTGSPYNAVYQNNTPNNEQLKHGEFKYQFSVKVPVWKNILNHPSSLYLGYTQLSYWQLYNQSAFFRETDYEPELYLANEVNLHLIKNWHITFLNVGADHQSNGFGNTLERSWNRMYVEAVGSSDNWMVSVKPWYVLSTYPNNRDIAKFLGYGQLVVAYKVHDNVIALSAHSLLERGGKSATGELTWSFPLTTYIKGYVQVFSGYGQSLIEYNHRTNSAGIGIALNDWV